MFGFGRKKPQVKLICLGDSHLEPLKLAADAGLVNVPECVFHIVPGATAVGLRNPNSATDALNLFKETLAKQPVESILLMQLGEVDCGFVMWFRADKYGESIDAQLQESLDAYESFLDYVLECGYKHICVTGATLPTIRDGVDWGEVANARSAVKSSLQDRTQLTLAYNRKLEEMARRKGFHYFDITGSVLNRNAMVVSDFFRHKNPTDHHLDSEKTAPLWADKVNDYLDSLAVKQPVSHRFWMK